ncbi:hypothetical protein GF314_08170 [bacterium]|nr:hypothetical protein [bacterium]
MALQNDCETAVLRGAADTPACDATASASAASGTASRPRAGNGLAQAISHLASPPVLTVVAALAAARADGQPVAFMAAAAFCVLGVVVPTAALVAQWRRGEVSDIEITRRDQRLWPLLLTTTSVGAAAIVLQLAGAPPAVAGLVSILGVQSLVLLAVTTSWKISVHCATAAAVGCLLSLLGGGPAPAIVLIGAMVWSRLQLRRHTPLQCLFGTSLGAVLVLSLWPLLGG